MTSTQNALTRDKERTRRAVLVAAERLFNERGANVSIADVAAAAQVSKSGLLHHFRNRDDLYLAVIEDLVDRIRADVYAHVDISENRPGKLLRAYVRALTAEDSVAMVSFSPNSMLTTMGYTAEVAEICGRDADAWRTAFAADGLDPALSLVVRNAAESLAASARTPYLTEQELDIARVRLLAMAEPE